MSTTPTLEEQIAMAGLAYGRRHDISYRTGLVIQVFGLALLAVLYPLENPFYTAGIMLFEIGVLLSAVYLLVWMRSVKKFIVSSVIIGLIMQVAGSIIAPEQYAAPVIIAGIGLVCVGASGMMGKEAYCFGYREGWLLAMFGLPALVLANLFGRENRVFNSVGFSIVFLLLLSLTGKKLKQRLLSSCTTNVCGMPERKA
jgi:uncharacterized integral membrane protein